MNRILHALAFACVMLLCGCTNLAPRQSLPQVFALAPYLDGELGRAVLASAPAEMLGKLSGFELLHDGPHALDARIALIDAAQRSLDVQYYILSSDFSGVQFLTALQAAARRGVRVRLLVDDLHIGDAEHALLALQQNEVGVEVRLFNPLPARGGSIASRLVRSLHEFSRINHRMHNKLLIADGVISISGGRNVADEYFMRAKDANFIDMDVVAVGAVVPKQAAIFDRYWNSQHSYPVADLVPARPGPPSARYSPIELLDLVPEKPDFFGNWSLSYQIAARRLALVWASAEVLGDAPEKINSLVGGSAREPTVNGRLHAIVSRAQRRLLIGSPYFVPGSSGMDVVRRLRQRGVQVTVVTNSLGSTDEPLVHARYTFYRSMMLDLGVDIYEMSPLLTARFNTLGAFQQSRGRLHSKVALIDERWLYVGSMNFDRRSASINTEAGLLIDSSELVSRFETLIDVDGFRSSFRVNRDDQGRTRWIESGPDGALTSNLREPNSSRAGDLLNWFLLTLVDEEWL